MDTKNFYTLLAVPSPAPASTVGELKALVAEYPWFSLAHQLLLEVSLRNGDSNYMSYTAAAAAYATDRQCFYWRLQKPAVEAAAESQPEKPAEHAVEFELLDDSHAPEKAAHKEKPAEEEKPAAEIVEKVIEKAPEKPQIIRQVVVVGGDYFTSNEFEDITTTSDDPVSKFIATRPKINPNTSPLNAIDFEDAPEERIAPVDYVTETLAKIYVNQELYDLAIDTYKKLILQIPEKSAYFAAQIKGIKKLKQ